VNQVAAGRDADADGKFWRLSARTRELAACIVPLADCTCFLPPESGRCRRECARCRRDSDVCAVHQRPGGRDACPGEWHQRAGEVHRIAVRCDEDAAGEFWRLSTGTWSLSSCTRSLAGGVGSRTHCTWFLPRESGRDPAALVAAAMPPAWDKPAHTGVLRSGHYDKIGMVVCEAIQRPSKRHGRCIMAPTEITGSSRGQILNQSRVGSRLKSLLGRPWLRHGWVSGGIH
jgi:hypothetical protein